MNRIPGGKGDKKDPRDVDPIQLGKGIQHEMEHTNDSALAIEIALDHLAEDPQYYSKLDQIEESLKEYIKLFLL